MARAGYKPVIEICGGTEIGGGFLAGSMLQPQSPSTFSIPTMGEYSRPLSAYWPSKWSCHKSQSLRCLVWWQGLLVAKGFFAIFCI